jgi:hypothetical protein
MYTFLVQEKFAYHKLGSKVKKCVVIEKKML